MRILVGFRTVFLHEIDVGIYEKFAFAKM